MTDVRKNLNEKSPAFKTLFPYTDDMGKEVLNALISLYITMIIVDFKTWEIHSLFLPEAVMSYMTKGKMKYRDIVPVFIKESIAPEYQEAVKRFLDPATIVQRLNEKGILSMNYMGKKLGWCRVRMIPSGHDENGQVISAVFVSQDINEEKRQERAMNYSIEHDYLTGAFNRSALEHVRLALSGPLAFLMTDIDHFKHYNDTYGHIVGDQMLQKVVRVLKATFRTIDYVIRLGGDEFAIILPGCQLRDNLEPIACKVAIINERLSHPDDALPAATISAGISFGDDGYQQVLYDQADQALYAAKHSGCGVFKAYQA